MERVHVLQPEHHRSQMTDEAVGRHAGVPHERLGARMPVRIRVARQQLQQPSVGAAGVAGVALEYPAVGQHERARPERAVGVEHGPRRHQLERHGGAHHDAERPWLDHAAAEHFYASALGA